ncbi:MAG: hypothetical protein ABW193_11635 [Luteibacter sp.]
MEERVADMGVRAALRNDDEMQRDLLLDPVSPYSMPRVPAGPVFSGAAWRRALQRMQMRDTPFTASQARRAVAWDLGLTHALPGLSAGGQPVAFAGGPLVQASLIKSGVSVDIYLQAIRLLGPDRYAAAAYYATAAQVLRARVAGLPAERRRSSGTREGVLMRFMLADNVADLSGSDWLYLSRLVEGADASWNGGRATPYGHRGLPVSLAAARVAAAYRLSLPFPQGSPCRASGLVDPVAAHGQLCLSHANDRAVHTWFRSVLAAQLAMDESKHGLWPPVLMPVMLPLADAAGVPGAVYDGRAAQAHAGHSEVADLSFLMDRLPAGGYANDDEEAIVGLGVGHLCTDRPP